MIEDEPLIALGIVSSLAEGRGRRRSRPVGTEKEALDASRSGDFDGAVLDANLHGRRVDDVAAALTRRDDPLCLRYRLWPGGLAGVVQARPDAAKPFSDQQLVDALVGLMTRSADVVRLKS